MSFPVYLDVFGWRMHPHLALEVVAYTGGFQLYLWLRRRSPTRLETERNLWVVTGAIVGAAVGSKLLAWAESFDAYRAQWSDPRAWLAGKTVVGGLLGGWVGVELAKWRVGVRRSTGDLMVFPLIFGMAVGRIGCFLTGLEDKTYGAASGVPWAVDFGDGVRRHPTQLYDVVLLATLAAVLWLVRDRFRGEGRMFRAFVMAYLVWRFAVEFIKPREIRVAALNLSAIQIASLAGAAVCLVSLFGRRNAGGPVPQDDASRALEVTS